MFLCHPANGQRQTKPYFLQTLALMKQANSPEEAPKGQINSVFPGGQSGLTDFMRANLQYPEESRLNNVGGTVFVQFVVNTDGTTSDFVILVSIDEHCDQEAIRLVKAMPAWTPGTLAGKPVQRVLVLPITFPPNMF